MIGTLYGKLEEKKGNHCILNVGNVGYMVFVSSNTFAALPETGGEIKVYTYLYVRETELELYGFLTQEEEGLFELLIGISGIGPKGALAVLSVATPKELRIAILHENDKLLTKISGIGKKTAQKIIIELKGKMEEFADEEGMAPEELSQKHDAIEALVALGYPRRDAREALSNLPPEIKDVGEKVKEALKVLGKHT